MLTTRFVIVAADRDCDIRIWWAVALVKDGLDVIQKLAADCNAPLESPTADQLKLAPTLVVSCWGYDPRSGTPTPVQVELHDLAVAHPNFLPVPQ